jgi:ubiquinone/menaquinone biosynthesis C-methylase UbiE
MDDKLLNRFNRVEKRHWWWEGRRELVKNLLRGIKPENILDIGCGTGETLSFLKKLYSKADLYGIDMSQKAVKYTKQKGHRNVYRGDSIKLPFKNNFFDVVLFLDVLEHIQNDKKAINEAKRVLKKNGIIIITAPALSFIWSKHDSGQGHQRRYTRTAIRKLARDNKLTTTFISYFNFFLSPPIILIRTLSNIPFLGWLSNYDSGMNYEIAFLALPNKILKSIFIFEIDLLRYIKYPIGISIAAKFTKN